jgi:integrase
LGHTEAVPAAALFIQIGAGPYTAWLPPEIRRDVWGYLFTRRDTRSAHYWAWNPVRAAFWSGLPEHRRRAIVDLDWHSLRHFAGWYFYVHLGFSDELTAYQLGHSDAKLIRELYGHGRSGALERSKRGSRVKVRPIGATSLPHAAQEGA